MLIPRSSPVPLLYPLKEEESGTADKVARNIHEVEVGTQHHSGERVIPKAQEFNQVEVLSDLDKSCQDENVEWKRVQLVCDECPDETVDEHHNQDITEVRSEEAIIDEDSNDEQYEKSEDQGAKVPLVQS